MNIVILGLSITSSWGNGHATTYRSLVRGLAARGHRVLFLERDVPWYAENRDLPEPPYGLTELYASLTDLKKRFAADVRNADLVIVGSYVPQGVEVGKWVMATAQGIKAFYDIDTPITLAKLSKGDTEYLSPSLAARYDLYLSFTGGPILDLLEKRYGVSAARVLYCSVDPALYYPETEGPEPRWHMGYLGTYSADRQPKLEELLIEPARRWKAGRFAVAGPMYPTEINWPRNVEREEHLAPGSHRQFYNSQCFTLNVTRAHMTTAGYSPSVRLFEAAACGVAIITDYWNGIETLLTPSKEILIARTTRDALAYLTELTSSERRQLADAARRRVLGAHTGEHRAMELETYVSALATV